MNELLNHEYDLDDDHFDIFVEEFNYWVAKYSLNNWEFHYHFSNDGDFRASVCRDHPGRLCIVVLNNKWIGTEPNDENLRLCAYHEATEMLLSKLNDLAHSRSVTADEIEEAMHTVIRTLENTHWQTDYDIRETLRESEETE